jgi:uncharacterized membrane protein YbhN (UPF0104 family)
MRRAAARVAGAGWPARRAAPTTAWAVAKRVLTVAFFAVVLWLLIDHARGIEWAAVRGSMRTYPLHSIAIAAALAAASHAVYASYDLISRHYIRHRLRTRQVATVAFVSYAFNLNLGALVGGFALRYRLYAHLGLRVDQTSRILALSMLTNWLGYLFVAGLVCLLRPLQLPPDWAIGGAALPAVGAVALLLVAGYLVVCFKARRRHWTVRGHRLDLPSGRIALLQLAVASLNWLLIAAIVFVLLQGRIDYPSVLSVLLIGAVAGVIAHIPAGLGVLEAVFVTLLSHRLPQSEVLGAVLAYRAVYYLAPLALAALLYFMTEARQSRASRRR